MPREIGLLALAPIVLVLLLLIHPSLGNDSYLRKNSTFVEYNGSEIISFAPLEVNNCPEKRLNEIKSDIEVCLDIENFDQIRPRVIPLVGNASGNLNIKQICNIYNYMCSNWGYINDPRGREVFQHATYTLKMGDLDNKIGYGDCDDFAILMASFIENIGGATMVVLASDPSGRSGHIFAEVYLGKLGPDGQNIDHIIEWLRKKYNNSEIGYDIPEPVSGEIWLNLDYNTMHPGGSTKKMAKSIPLVLRGETAKKALTPSNDFLKNTFQSVPDLLQNESEYKLNYLLRNATALQGDGEYEEAIKEYEEIIKEASQSDFPYEVGSALNGMGAAYKCLSIKNDKENYLQRAISSYKESLNVLAMESYPMDYAWTQAGLGDAYRRLAEDSDKETNLKLAIDAYEKAIKILTAESHPVDYAQIQTSLGDAYMRLA
jgi:tetratricopeptide (TPR) repeat protein